MESLSLKFKFYYYLAYILYHIIDLIMKREDDGKETFEFEEPDKKVEIGTEILDPSLPSNLDF